MTLRILLGVVVLSSLAWADNDIPPKAVGSKPFGTFRGQPVTLYTLSNKNGMSISVMDYGATLVNLVVPDRQGKPGDVILGFDHLSSYLGQTDYLGATVGRYGNRIAQGEFILGKNTYHLAKNNGPNSLHGGLRGFDKFIWKMEPVDSPDPAIRFSRLSPDGEEGFPGNLFVSVTFTLSHDENQLRISYQATTDKLTVLNLTNHSYFNLAGGGNVLDDVLTLHADFFLPVDDTLIPSGELKKVEGTPWDFRAPTAIGSHLKDVGNKPLGFDHNYVLKKGFFSNWSEAAEVDDPQSGRTLKVFTDQPGVQFYTGNFLDGSHTGKGRIPYRQYSGFCLETQHYPDSPHHDNFPSTALNPGDVFKSSTVYQFGVTP